MDYRFKNNKDEYFVKWEGYSIADNTWQRVSDMQSAQDLIDEFHAKYGTLEELRSQNRRKRIKRRWYPRAQLVSPSHFALLLSNLFVSLFYLGFSLKTWGDVTTCYSLFVLLHSLWDLLSFLSLSGLNWSRFRYSHSNAVPTVYWIWNPLCSSIQTSSFVSVCISKLLLWVGFRISKCYCCTSVFQSVAFWFRSGRSGVPTLRRSLLSGASLSFSTDALFA